jgi:hypothetical protein
LSDVALPDGIVTFWAAVATLALGLSLAVLAVVVTFVMRRSKPDWARKALRSSAGPLACAAVGALILIAFAARAPAVNATYAGRSLLGILDDAWFAVPCAGLVVGAITSAIVRLRKRAF